MPTILTPSEAKAFYKWSIWTRPVLTYSLIVCIVVITFVISMLLITGKSSMADASTVIATLIGSFFPVLTALVLGKSYERSKGVNDEGNIARDARDAEVDSATNDFASLATASSDPLETLRSLDLKDFHSQPADDKPDIH